MSMSGESDGRAAGDHLRERRQVQAGDATAPDARGPIARDVAPGRDGVALGGDGDLRPQRADAGLEAGSTSSGAATARPCGVLQARGANVAGLLPDRVRGAVDAEVDVQRARVRPADRDRAAERARDRGAALHDVRVHVAVADPDDRDPVAVADRDLDLARRARARDRRAPAPRQAPAIQPRDERVRDAAVQPQVGDRARAVTRDVDVADASGRRRSGRRSASPGTTRRAPWRAARARERG